jgi:phosphohistidine phosphatase
MLWLLRHADAAEALEGQDDADRPLTDRGRRQAQDVGEALKRLGVPLDACVSSPRLRALDTAKLVCEPLGLDIQIAPELRGGPFDAEGLAAAHGEHVLLVGHEPDFSLAIHDLTGAHVRMKKAALAAVDRGELMAFLRPKDLAAMAGAPTTG